MAGMGAGSLAYGLVTLLLENRAMNILVCISQSPDTTSRIAFTAGDTQFDSNGVTYIVNPYDEWYALVRAIELKEALGGQVTTVTVGPAACEQVIRKALAIGADDAVRIDAEPVDAMQVSRLIADFVRTRNFDLILAGKETIDHNGGMVPGMVAEWLDWPYVASAVALEVNGAQAAVKREVAGGTESLSIALPLVLSAAKGMAEQRIPNMRGIMAARTKALDTVPGGGAEVATEVVKFTLPPAKGACRMVPADQPEELVRLLREEAKII